MEEKTEKQETDVPPLPQWQCKRLVAVLRNAILYRPMLNDFERRLVDDVTSRYAAYGDRIRVSDKQYAVLIKIGEKTMYGENE